MKPLIYLKPLTLKDASKEYQSWLNDPKLNFLLETRKATIKSLKEYIQKHNDDPNALLFGIFYDNIHIGNITLAPIDWVKKTAEFGILIGNRNYWGKGIGTKVTKLTVDYAFNKLGLTEITLGTMVKNKRAKRTFEKAGFKVTGKGKKKIKKTGEIYSQIKMGIKKEEL